MSTSIEKARVAAIYNPQTQSKSDLIDGFVVRQNTFQRLYKAIKEAKMEVPEQHYLIRGRRGMGKTTLLLRLAYEIENDKSLNSWLIPIIFNEEEYGIRRLFNLWERVMGLLEQKHPDFRFEEAELRRLSAQHKDDDAYERLLFDWLESELKRTGKKIILFIDNFGDMTRKMTDEEAHRLRKILQTSSDIRIFAASAVVLEAFYRYDHPFYEFFKTIELKGLDEKETRELLLQLSKHYKNENVAHIVEQHPGRVEALRRITGGVIRTMVLLFEIFADDEDGSAFKDLEVVLDRVTPLYKHRMDDLSDQQQAIVEAIALNWDALSVKEITEITRLESKIISAQLQNLEKNGIIQKIPTKTKNNLYIVAERFFNVWYLMRNGRRSDEKRVLWLVRFFEDWCDNDMMKKRADGHLLALRRGGFDPEAAFSYTQALAQTRKLSAADRHELLQGTRTFLLEASPGLAKDLMTSELDQAYEALELWFSGQQEKSIDKLAFIFQNLQRNEDTQFDNLNDKNNKSFWEQRIGGLSASLGYDFATLNLPEFKKSEQCWLWAATLGHSGSMFNLGAIFYYQKKDIEKAIEWYEKAAVTSFPKSMFRLGLIYTDEKKDFDRAYYWFDKAAKEGDTDAMSNLGWIYQYVKKDIENALVWYEKASDAGNYGAMFNLGAILHDEKKDIDKAIYWYEKAGQEGDTDAMFNLGHLYENEKMDTKKALEWFEKGATGGSSISMNGYSWLLFEHKQQKEDALNWTIKSLKEDAKNSWYHHTAACVLAWSNRLSESKNLVIAFITNQVFLGKHPDETITYFTLLLAKNEAKWLLELFTSPDGEAAQLKDRFKPIYYAILKTLDHPDALRMGEELQQTVDEILAKAKQMAVDYA